MARIECAGEEAFFDDSEFETVGSTELHRRPKKWHRRIDGATVVMDGNKPKVGTDDEPVIVWDTPKALPFDVKEQEEL